MFQKPSRLSTPGRLILLLAIIGSCDRRPPVSQTTVVENYADLVYASYSDLESSLESLKRSVDAFVANPTAENMAIAREAWINARDVYGPTEAFRFYGGPIDGEEGPEALMNAWPLDEAYIDYTVDDPKSGVINNPAAYPEINKELLVSLNERNGEENISAGFHAVEFLLWGQDLSADGPGNRAHTDFTSAPNANRRGKYLSVATDLLLNHARLLKEEWAPGKTDNYRAAFVAANPEESLQKMFTGIGMLSGFELSGERMLVAYETRDQEDEHSCFSDNTHADIIGNQQGIANVFFGEYGTVNGPGLYDLIAARDSSLADEIQDQVEASNAAVRAIPVPFDQTITAAEDSEEREKLLTAIESLEIQAELIAEAASTLGLEININEG